MTNLDKFKQFCEKEDISNYLLVDEKETFSPASEYFYTKILESKDVPILKKLDDDQFLERCYACLIAWRLNRGQSWLVSFEDFKTQLNQQRENLIKLDKIKYLEKLDFETHKDIFEDIFKNWNFVKIKKGEKFSESKFVSISKTLHFLLPNLVIPMDNAYTSRIINFQGSSDKQCEFFLKVLNVGKALLDKHKDAIDKYYIDTTQPNMTTKPKLIDNIIINYVNKLPKKEKKGD